MASLESSQEVTIRATAVSPGIAIGRVWPLRDKFADHTVPKDVSVPENRVQEEVGAFHHALEATRQELLALRKELLERLPNGNAGIFDAHLLIVDDHGMNSAVENLIRKEHKSALFAFYQTSERYAAALGATEDEYLRERAADIRDVAGRIRRHLENQEEHASGVADRRIIAAPELSPSETAALDREKVLGFMVESGSAVCHTAILARSMRLPALTGVPKKIMEKLSAADTAIIDGFHGLLILNPEPRTEEAYRLKAEQAGKVFSALRSGGMRPQTLDGFEVNLAGNIDSAAEVPELLSVGADGVGLMRSEYLFNRPEAPDEEMQFAAYRDILTACDGHPVVIRTLDVGGDKLFRSMSRQCEPNPFLGLRGIRLMLKERQDVFRTQLRALLRAGVYGDLHIMLPMVSGVVEVRETRQLIETYRRELAAENAACVKHLPLGVMIETPAAALQADILAEEADFFSIGTNDLTQYTLAMDRSNDRVSYLYEPGHPAVLQLIARTAAAAAARGIPVAVCGQMAGDPCYTALLAGLGIQELSMDAGAIGAVRRVLCGMTMAEARHAAVLALRAPDAASALNLSRKIMEKAAPDLAALL